MSETRRTFGTTRQERSGRWSARYTLDGRQISVPGTFPNKSAAEKRLAEIQAEIGKDAHVHSKKAAGTLSAYWGTSTGRPRPTGRLVPARSGRASGAATSSRPSAPRPSAISR